MNLRAVLFDYGMVLSTPPVVSAHLRLLGISALSADVFDRHYWAHRHAFTGTVVADLGSASF